MHHDARDEAVGLSRWQIFHTKQMIEETMAEREVALFCDIHGHSQKLNAFLYGCDASSWTGYPHATL
eukprot:1948910-Rhodomonas_salina.3